MSSVSKKQRRFRAFLLIVGGFCLLSGIFVPWLGRKYLRQDRANATSQQAVGEIAFVTEAHEERGVHLNAMVEVRFVRGLAQVNKITDAEAKQYIVGQKVNITYRVGKFKVYVDSIAPLSNTKKAQ